MSNFKKEIIPLDKFYLAKFSKNLADPYLLFIHGGPGFNCKVIEHLIENENLFENANFNLILYDQRGCGRSTNFSNTDVSHENNINDIREIYLYVNEVIGLNIAGMIGHSYGAKLLFDFQIKFNLNIPSIFVATANSILIPRLNNLMIDLAYLKRTNEMLHQEILSEMDNMDLKNIWKITEKLAPIFKDNKDRHYFNWANLDCFNKVKSINPEINAQVFSSVRKDLYSNEDKFSVNIHSLNIKYLWINGFHDFIMNGYGDAFLPNQEHKKIFYKSSHYPHIEENDLFCKVLNSFLEDTN